MWNEIKLNQNVKQTNKNQRSCFLPFAINAIMKSISDERRTEKTAKQMESKKRRRKRIIHNKKKRGYFQLINAEDRSKIHKHKYKRGGREREREMERARATKSERNRGTEYCYWILILTRAGTQLLHRKLGGKWISL